MAPAALHLEYPQLTKLQRLRAELLRSGRAVRIALTCLRLLSASHTLKHFLSQSFPNSTFELSAALSSSSQVGLGLQISGQQWSDKIRTIGSNKLGPLLRPFKVQQPTCLQLAQMTQFQRELADSVSSEETSTKHIVRHTSDLMTTQDYVSQDLFDQIRVCADVLSEPLLCGSGCGRDLVSFHRR